jgi:hypothetical protein
MKELNILQMEEIEGGVRWACVGIAAVGIASSGGLGAIFFLAAGVAAGCFD